MTYTPRLLASGQVATSKGAIYTCPTGMRVQNAYVHYDNTSAGVAQTCETYINDGTSRRFDKHQIPVDSPYVPNDKLTPIHLKAGQAIEALTTTANVLNFHVFGEDEQVGVA